ncbi:MAG TPA: V-type ATP synthase subunit B [Acidimicrobiales bacterium]|nr:V-type ATP synthase subunit B [Acidimicrobiales bacterium]
MNQPVPEVRVEHRGAVGAEGPLLFVRGAPGVGWDEFAEVRLPSGEMRQGLVLEVHGDLAVIEVMQGTSGIDPATVSTAFSGHPFEVPVGDGWLGRVWDGLGRPLDGGPPMLGTELRPVTGLPVNPIEREVPREPVITGVSVIDAVTTLVRGQKLPVFSVAGLPHLELAGQIASQAHAGGQPFKVVFVAMGLTSADAATIRDILESRAAAGDLALFLDTADDPVVQRVLAPRVALTVAEHLAFDLGQHVLVVLADMTSYCEALREVSAARGEVPGRRAYPGYLYSDLASIYERCGRLKGRPGSLTQVPVLTMPAGDITHPVADLTGYITEGQIVLSPGLYGRGLYPPVDVLDSLSRLMRKGTGAGLTRDDHPRVAAELVAAESRSRQLLELVDLIGESALSPVDRIYLSFHAGFESELVDQEGGESRPMDETLDRAWRALSLLPRSELTMVSEADLDRFYTGADPGG